MKRYGKAALVMALFMLAACQHPQKSSDTAAADVENNRCGASDYQNYIGKPLTAVNGLHINGPVRVIPYHSAVTMDFNLNRLNFLGDKDDVISRVYCG